MGGGVSSAAAEHMEEMVAYSVLLGRNITCMSFPGIHLFALRFVSFCARGGRITFGLRAW